MLVTPEMLREAKAHLHHVPMPAQMENLKLNIAPEILEAAKRDYLAHQPHQQYRLQELTHVHMAAGYCGPKVGEIDINVAKGGHVVIN